MTYHYRREVTPPPGWRPLPMIDEAERLAYFTQSAGTVGGRVPEYRPRGHDPRQ